jgi:hypothetical protein
LEDVLGLLGMVVFIVATIAFAAGVTYLVAKITPSGPKNKPPKPAED